MLTLGVIYFLVPLLLYFGLVFRPWGRPFISGFTLVGLLLAFLWASYARSFGPIFTGDPRADAYGVAAISIYTAVWVLAGVVQLIGKVAARQVPGLPYWAIAIFIFVAAAVPALFLLGV